MKIYTLIDNETNQHYQFSNEDDAIKWKKFKGKQYSMLCNDLISRISAFEYIVWDDVPKQFNYIYRDSTGVYACYYNPKKTKWFNNDYSVMKMYGGESFKLEHKPYHELFDLGQYYERPYWTSHFINWNKIKGTHFIKYSNCDERRIDIFDKDGTLLYSGTNDEVNVIDETNTLRFNTFFDQTYHFVKDDFQTGVKK